MTGSPMETDTAVLAAGAEKFGLVGDGLRKEIGNIDMIAGGLVANWRGAAGTAAQQAFERFQLAADAQTRALDEISSNIRNAGLQYTTTDDDQTSVMQSTIPDIRL